METEDLITDEAAAEFLHISKGTLAQWRYLGTGPRYFKVGRKILYRRSTLVEWLEAQERQGTAEVPA